MLRLMIVDDELIIRESLSEMIDYESLGYQLIATAKNGMQAYDIICDEYPDVVITDIQMPILNGLDLIERAAKSDSRIIFIVLSGYSEFEYAKQAMRYGVRHYLLKPTDKQELIETLESIRNERSLEEFKREEQQSKLLCDLQTPLEHCFLMESLEYQEDFSNIFKKYRTLLSIPSSCLHACICSFVEEPYLKSFVISIKRILSSYRIALLFSIIYVKNSAILIFPASTLTLQKEFKEILSSLQYPGQSVSFEASFIHADTPSDLFLNIILKISRFERILVLNENADIYELKNNLTAPWRISRIAKSLEDAVDCAKLSHILDSLFTDTLLIDTAKNIALSLLLKLNTESEKNLLDTTSDFFRRLYSCSSVAEIRELMYIVLLKRNPDHTVNANSSLISLLKSYVEKNIGSEKLSLKWLAENYLFVSIGYLSKQFVKEEGIRFSDYLNQKRIEEAKRLMAYYHTDNIKDIARQVGFNNNPQYFGQVFKRYTGMTPTNYMENIN